MDIKDIDVGLADGWGGKIPLRLSRGDRLRHLYVIGQTGTGKSTLFKNVFAQDIANGSGCALIDPHGDLALEVLDTVPSNRIDDVVILDPSDISRPVGFNPFYRVPKDERSLVAANITATFKSIWRDSWGPRLEYILFNVVAALLDAPDELRPSFVSIPRVLVQPEYRNQVVRHIKDPRIRSFFLDEFARWNDRMIEERLGSVQNKIGQFLSNPFVRNIVGQWKPSVDIADIMKHNRILVVRLSKGTLGEEPANLLGSFIVSGIQQTAMRRAAIPEHERTDFHLLIDEFHSFTTDAFASVLAESRKYALSLTIGAQFHTQSSEKVRNAIFGNVGSIISFRVSAGDADVLAKEIGEYAPSVFRDLGRGEICARLTRDGEPSSACLGVTLAQGYMLHGHRKNILHQARMRYGNDRNIVEKNIRQWLG